MKLLAIALMVLVAGVGRLVADDQTSDPEILAVKKSVDSYVAAFNGAEADKLAAHWTEQGEYVTPSGERWQGRTQLATNFTQYFSTAKNAKLELINPQFTLQSPSVAMETGVARVVVPNAEPMETEYQAVHMKTAEGWKIDSLREVDAPVQVPSHYEELKELEWLVGQWRDTSEQAQVETSCRWSTNQNFLIQTFKVYAEDSIDFEATQIIGWDPHAQTIRSWTFDSDGGFGAGRWTKGEGRWNVQSVSVLPDGRRGSATHVFEVVDENTAQYRSVGRQVDGELLPNIGPITIVRANAE